MLGASIMTEVILSRAHNRGRQVAAYAGYRILLHPCGYEIAYRGWHLHTVRTFPEVLDYIRECAILGGEARR
jgi:hypothetical protein